MGEVAAAFTIRAANENESHELPEAGRRAMPNATYSPYHLMKQSKIGPTQKRQ